MHWTFIEPPDLWEPLWWLQEYRYLKERVLRRSLHLKGKRAQNILKVTYNLNHILIACRIGRFTGLLPCCRMQPRRKGSGWARACRSCRRTRPGAGPWPRRVSSLVMRSSICWQVSLPYWMRRSLWSPVPGLQGPGNLYFCWLHCPPESL